MRATSLPFRPILSVRYLGLRAGRLSLVGLLLGCLATNADASAFQRFEQGTAAAGLAGSYTARADDPSALFYNLGGLAFFQEAGVMAGTVVSRLGEGQFQGRAPGVAAGGVGSRDTPIEVLPHLYVVKPLGKTWVGGLGVNSPFVLNNTWDKPETFPGRTISTDSQIQTYDLTGAVAWNPSPTMGFGFGVVYRLSELSVDRRYQQTNPFLGAPADVGALEIRQDSTGGLGWQVGLLHRPNDGFSWGFSYRSEIEIEMNGSGTLSQVLTGDDQFDAIIATSLPFGQELLTVAELHYPATASLATRFAIGKATDLSLDVVWTGWSSFEAVEIRFPNDSLFSSVIRQDFDDVVGFRLGLAHRRPSGAEFRFGAAFDPSPQPDETVGPFLADADRTSVALGYGRDWLGFSVGFQQSSARTTLDNLDGVNGSYEAHAFLLGLSLDFGN